MTSNEDTNTIVYVDYWSWFIQTYSATVLDRIINAAAPVDVAHNNTAPASELAVFQLPLVRSYM